MTLTWPGPAHRSCDLVTAGERQMIASLVATHCSGEARLIEGGSFLGAATTAILHGMGARRFAHPRPLITIDRFVADDDYIVEALLLDGHDIRPGESFLTAFLDAIGDGAARVEVRAGDLLRVGRLSDPVDFIMIDIAKSPTLYVYLLREWLTKAIAGRTIIVHQDWWSPLMPWLMSMTAPILGRLELIVPQEGESAAFRLATPLSADDFAQVSPPRTLEEVQERYAAICSAFPAGTHALVLMNEASSALGVGAVGYAAERLDEADRLPGGHQKRETWSRLIRQWVDRRLRQPASAG